MAGLISLIDRSVLSKAYFSREHVARHQLDSFNNFLQANLQKVVNEQKIIETDIEIRGKSSEPVWVELGKIEVKKPLVREADGSQGDLFPSEARLRNLTYAAPIMLELTLVQGEERQEPVVTTIGQLPIMVGSASCNLYGMSDTERISHGEDPFDPGGYFIVNGTERVLMTLEDLASNKIMTEFTERYNERIYVAKVFSQFRGYRALVVVERNRKNLLEVSFPSVAGHLRFVDLMRSLGLVSDHEIVNAVSTDEDILTFMMQNLEESECDSLEGGIMYVGKKLAPNQTRDYQRKRAEFVLDNYLLPHLNYLMPVTLKEGDEGYQEAVAEVRLAKAHFLGRMAEACFDLVLSKRRIDDKDHYSNKRLKLAGDLMEDLFRISLNRLTRDIKYQLERASMRHRDLSIGTAVRADVLTERLLHPLATGNWVGGRTGVSQLLDRIDHMSVLSHLRRVISPLSRSQPHFEARDLHPTQWGRICPSETPEGPNCGLVKNFAQMVEISRGVPDEDEVIRMLYTMGVEHIRGDVP
ncbi:MAG: DNA-directed RNA polymerase subunit B'' [Methanomicrobiales archaeon]|jgi:DNA-directed RNA polymerase subunit B"|nr:DNA-directed RNA polymerase subunit B'' [Burkholderiaceae bacterium]HNO08578.1 DNA-directed RNA polymerase subunit B'' [Methanoregulaceae archaeon]HNW80765.1 DNA-directed RNA polymerase subunit B'' [Methanoregulaceae archaeon]HPA07799.1 DNA-directed RNA polymerase subunit B'' [Methanoregulaceae archaeon]HPS22439.1 DNA-directed RNA polymerase subunit B'' [Methanoregulaceae archaeon]